MRDFLVAWKQAPLPVRLLGVVLFIYILVKGMPIVLQLMQLVVMLTALVVLLACCFADEETAEQLNSWWKKLYQLANEKVAEKENEEEVIANEQ